MHLIGMTLTLFLFVRAATAQTLREPVVAKIKQGEVQRYVIEPVLSPRRHLTISLYSLKGDADLFVGFEADVAPDKHALKSTNGPMQADQAIYQEVSRPLYVAVYGAMDTEYVLSISEAIRDVQTTPSQPRVLKITSQTINGTDTLLVTGLTLENLTAAWYEVTITKEGKVLEKSGMPQHLILGPKQRRYYGYVALDDQSKLTFQLTRNTTKARAYLVADMVVRLVNGGKPLAPEVGDAVEDLMPRLFALAPAAIRFQQGDWKGGGAEVLRVVKQRPDVLYALQQVVNRSGVNISRVILVSKIGAGFGALSATMQAKAVTKSPLEEKVEVALKREA